MNQRLLGVTPSVTVYLYIYDEEVEEVEEERNCGLELTKEA